MKPQPVAVTLTITPVADVAATSAQARLPGAPRQAPNRRSIGGRFPAPRDRAAQPGLPVILVADKAMPPEAARPRPATHRYGGSGQAGKGRR